ncbi:RHS repeat-associated core domain-containing protein [Micromonospora sp. NPDC049060]|uniref:RHS repeat-associated core domain-containing protein n=1 Tax=Micromonospora sp. NPDC049060 TaxID=3154828 RepID=UPI00340194FC
MAVDAVTQQAKIRRETPFGTPRGTSPAWPNEKGFVGGTKDNTGLTHLGAREYDPAIGRFISVDPVMDLSDPQQMNGYNYSNNSPVNASDPSGLKQCGNDDCSMYTTPTPDGEIVHEPGGKKTRVKKYRPNTCSGRFCIGAPHRPVNHGPWDDDFVYDPKAKATPADIASRAKWQAYRYGCIASVRAGVGPCADWGDAPYMYDRYASGTGEPYVFDFAPAYDQDPFLREVIDAEIAAAQRASEQLAGKSGSHSFQITGQSQNIRSNPATERWQKTLGSFDIWASAEVTVTGDTVAMRITIHAEDRWDFNKDAKDIATGISDNENGRFAELGWAKGFNSSGSMVKDVVWKAGSPKSATVTEPYRQRW